MKKIGVICLVLCLLTFLITPVRVSALDENTVDKSVQQGCHSIDAQVPLLGSVPFTENAKSIILYEYTTDTLMYAYNVDEQQFPSSFVKIMTGLIAVEKGNLESAVTVKQSVLNTIPNDAVSAELRADEIISLEDLLYCMLVHSANDAAAVIADHISGSQEAFVAEMNAYAQRLGCTGTNFMNPHGLHHELQVTTARDTARILATAMKNEDFAEIFNTAFYTVPATNKSPARRFETTNHLINNLEYATYYDLRVTGGRTGVTDDGYRCIAAASESDGLKMVSVVMGTHSVFEEDSYVIKIIGGFLETSALLDMGYAGYKEAQILYDGLVVKQQAVTNGDSNVILGSKTELSTVVPYGVEQEDLIYRYNDIPGAFQAPVKKGDVLSQVEIWYGSVCLGHVDLYAMNDVSAVQVLPDQEPPSIPKEKNGVVWKVILWIVVGVVACVLIAFVIILILRRIRRALAHRRRQQYSRSRRRSR